MKYLPKTYVFTDRDDFEISYDDIIERIMKGFYEEFRLTPSRSSIRLVTVAEGFLSSEYHVQVLFVLLDTKKCGMLPKRYLLDLWSCSVEVLPY
ncbi:hypothetical protein [Ruminococcus sp.]|uniref:hypothetical protein n=1 Tax=Ruminococcus sp. TaxID=41978 RepID=UPI0025F4A17D|nr:hypothetical protein [Ruminococcus sp.]MBQ8966272.1 hypothetical protein [Ruminococcus sp.]